MRLAAFEYDASTRLGAVVDGGVLDLSQALPRCPASMCELLAGGSAVLATIEQAVRTAKDLVPLPDVRLLSPIARPPKFLAIGLNYADHVAEAGMEPPQFPLFFNKQSTCVTGPYDPIYRPRASDALDYEGELGFVIGQRCRHVPRERAHEVIAGYLVVNDVSVRDWQARSATFTLGKSWDSHGPIGPWIVTADEVADPHGLDIRTWVNGDLRQSSNTRELIFDCYAMVETLSTVFTLEPGDIIATGTSGGVGVAMDPPQSLVPGDTVKVAIDGIGAIENTIVDEPDDEPRIGDSR